MAVQSIYQTPTPRFRFDTIEAQSNPSDFGSQTAQGLDVLSQGLDKAGQAVNQGNLVREEQWAQQTTSQAAVYWQQQMANAKQALESDPSQGDAIVDNFKTSYQDYTEKMQAQAPSTRASNLMTNQLNDMGKSLFGDTLNMAAKARVDYSTQSYLSTMDNLKTLANGPTANVSLNPDGTVQSSFAAVRSAAENAAKTASTVMPGAVLKPHQMDFQSGIDKDEIDQASIQLGSIKTAQLIQGGQLGKNLTIPQRLQQVTELQRQGRMETEQALSDASKQLKSLGENLENGGTNTTADTSLALHAYAAANGNAVEATKYLDEQEQKGKELATQNSASAELNAISNGSVPDISSTKLDEKAGLEKAAEGIATGTIPYSSGMTALQAYASANKGNTDNPVIALQNYKNAYAEGKTVLDNAQQVSTINQKLKTMNPVEATAYVSKLIADKGESDPVVQRVLQYEKQRQELILPQSPKFDPVTFTNSDTKVQAAQSAAEAAFPKAMSGDADSIAAVKAGVAATYGMQKQWGAKGIALQPISKAKAQNLVDVITSATASPGQATQVIDGIKNAYGDYAPDVFRSMSTLNGDGQKLTMPLQVLAGLSSNLPFRNDFAESLSVDTDKKPAKEADAKAISDTLDNNPSLQNWQKGLSSIGLSASQIEDASRQMKSTIANYAQVLSDKKDFGASTPESAANIAASHVIDSLHGFGNSNGQTLMIPRGDGSGGIRNNDVIGNINSNLEQEKRNIFGVQSNFAVDIRGLQTRFPHMSLDESRDMSMEDARENSFWTIGNGAYGKANQAVLMFRNPDTNQKVPLFDTKGNPITRNVDTLTGTPVNTTTPSLPPEDKIIQLDPL